MGICAASCPVLWTSGLETICRLRGILKRTTCSLVLCLEDRGHLGKGGLGVSCLLQLPHLCPGGWETILNCGAIGNLTGHLQVWKQGSRGPKRAPSITGLTRYGSRVCPTLEGSLHLLGESRLLAPAPPASQLCNLGVLVLFSVTGFSRSEPWGPQCVPAPGGKRCPIGGSGEPGWVLCVQQPIPSQVSLLAVPPHGHHLCHLH